MQRPIPYTDVMIDPMNDAEVQHWAKDVQVETYDLRAAMKLVGPLLWEVRTRHLSWNQTGRQEGTKYASTVVSVS
jgi:hypothetical protein